MVAPNERVHVRPITMSEKRLQLNIQKREFHWFRTTLLLYENSTDGVYYSSSVTLISVIFLLYLGFSASLRISWIVSILVSIFHRCCYLNDVHCMQNKGYRVKLS